MENNIIPETKELIEEIGEVIKPKPELKPSYTKLIIALLIVLVLALAGAVFFLLRQSKISNNLKSIEPESAIKNSPTPAPSIATSVDTTTWAIYSDKEAGFSFKYPADLVSVNNGELKNIDGISMSVAAVKLADIPEDLPSLMGRKDALLEKENLAKGEVTNPVKIGSLTGSTSTEYSRFEVCSLFFSRKLTFYPGDYRVSFILNGPEKKIVQEMPSFFKVDESNCGLDLVWDHDKVAEFDGLLQKNKGSGMAQKWYNTFDEIVKTIELTKPNNASISAAPISPSASVSGLIYKNETLGFQLTYEAPYRILTSKDDLSAYPHGVALIYTGGQAYDIIIEVWDSKVAYESEYSTRMADITIIENKGKFITLLNNTASKENQKVIDSAKKI